MTEELEITLRPYEHHPYVKPEGVGLDIDEVMRRSDERRERTKRNRDACNEWMQLIGPIDEPAYVYRMIDYRDEVIYVGSTRSLTQRLRGHWKDQPWIGEVRRVEWEMLPDRATAYDVEEREIRDRQPKHNKQGRVKRT